MKWLPILFAGFAFGQAPEQVRTFAFVHAQSPQQMQEIVNTVRSIGEVQRVSVDPQAPSMTVAGNADQLTLTSWLVTELDKTSSAPQQLTVRENSFPDSRSPAVRIVYPAHVDSPQSAQELVNGIRSIAEVQRVMVVNAAGAIVIRGSAEQVALAEWLARQFDDPTRGVRETQYDDTISPPAYRSTAVRVYAPKQIVSPQDIQETINAIRSIAEIQRAVAFTRPGQIVLRGTTGQVALADWMMKELDQAAPAAAAMHETTFGDSVVKSAFLAKNADVAGSVKRVREITGMQRVVAAQRPRAILLRGTPGQIALAEGLLR